MTAISFTNTLHGETAAKIAQRVHARFINTGMTATLLGAVSSDGLEDGRVVSGIGGQSDFVAMAHDLPGARSILAIRASRIAALGKQVSNIVWTYGNTSIPRQLRDIIVTEYGIADLRGAPDGQCVAAMLSVADSAFQSGLQAAAVKSGKLATSFTLPLSATDNRPQRIDHALAPARARGLLPMFPLGTEMTEVEQALVEPLGRLKRSAPLQLVRMLVDGLAATPTETEAAALARLALMEPATWRNRLLRGLVLGAMRR